MNKIEKTDLEKYRKSYLTVGRLRKLLDNSDLEDDALVMIERVEDVYFEEHSWKVYPKDSNLCEWIREVNRKMQDDIGGRERGEVSRFPDLDDPSKHITTEEELKDYQNQYHPAFSAFMYTDEKELFINLHY